MFADTVKLLKAAQKGNYAVGHFNINNLEILQGVVWGAQDVKAPVIVAVSEGALSYSGLRYVVAMVEAAAKCASGPIPIALHLDHGRNLDIISKCINAGFSSVMFDGSHLPFEENVRMTAKVVKMAHAKGVQVEAELGTIGGAEDTVRSKNIQFTDPLLAQEFVRRTGCDILAVAIGTSHGAFKFSGRAKLRVDILDTIRKYVKIPLVLHGASGVPRTMVRLAEKYGAQLQDVEGVPDSQIRLAISKGICKINTDTDLRIAFDVGVRRAAREHPADIDPRHMLGPAREMIRKTVAARITLFGSNGKWRG